MYINKELEEFINLKDERKNSAYAKLKLLIYGVKDAPETFGKFQDTFKEQLSSTNEKTILNVLSQASGSLFYEITEATDIDLEICIESSANLKLFVLNRSNGDVNLNLTIHVDQDATCQMGLLDLQDGKFNWKQYVDLKKAGADTTEVKKLFRTNVEDFKAKEFDIIP